MPKIIKNILNFSLSRFFIVEIGAYPLNSLLPTKNLLFVLNLPKIAIKINSTPSLNHVICLLMMMLKSYQNNTSIICTQFHTFWENSVLVFEIGRQLTQILLFWNLKNFFSSKNIFISKNESNKFLMNILFILPSFLKSTKALIIYLKI